MIVTDQPQEMRTFLDGARQAGKVVGFHPTMGALHGGHKANIRRAAAECDVVAVSIYVNPLQFGPAEDLSSYPRDLDADLAAAEQAGADIVLAPSVDALFPEVPVTVVSVGRLGTVWEGRARPGHFDGVATIVAKLLSLAGPGFAYFGEKDFQQLVIVRRVALDLSLPMVVVPCATVRETDGLALSSRNAYLGPAEREVATGLYWSLLAGKRAAEEQGVSSGEAVRAAMVGQASRHPGLALDYAEVVSPSTLEALSVLSGEARLIIAGRVGTTRLIDNLPVHQREG